VSWHLATSDQVALFYGNDSASGLAFELHCWFQQHIVMADVYLTLWNKELDMAYELVRNENCKLGIYADKGLAYITLVRKTEGTLPIARNVLVGLIKHLKMAFDKYCYGCKLSFNNVDNYVDISARIRLLFHLEGDEFDFVMSLDDAYTFIRCCERVLDEVKPELN
jgi:hypothetical protein